MLDRHISVESIRSPLNREQVAEICTDDSLSVVAVDIPFGWPTSFAMFVNSWSPVAGDQNAVPDPERFFYRETDRIALKITKSIFSISADKFAWGARAWAEIIIKYNLRSQIRVGVAGITKTDRPALIEVYPAATIAVVAQRSKTSFKGYKGDEEMRKTLIMALLNTFAIDDEKSKELISIGKDSDKCDALVAALTALMYLNKFPGWEVCRPSKGRQLKFAKKEGWIFFPKIDPVL